MLLSYLAKMIYSIIYVSKALHPMTSEHLTILLEQSNSCNREYGITGMLIYLEGHEPSQTTGRFMQVIEGNESDIQLLYKKIKADERHGLITTLHQGFSNRRNFSQWSMGFKTLTNDDLRKDGYRNLSDFFMIKRRQPKFSIALNYLKSFYDMNL